MLGDCHVHMVLDGVDYRKAIALHRDHVCDEAIQTRLQVYADAGVDYLRDGGDAFGAAKRAAELAGAYGIEYRTPIYPICRKGRYGEFIGRAFADMREYRALVDEAIASGADFIKIMISGLMDFNCFGVITSVPLDRKEIQEMIAIAHDKGLAVMAHANGAQTIRDALDAGVDSVEHGAYMDDECVAQLAESNAIWVPTLVTIGNLIGCGRYDDAVLKPLLDFQMENVRKCAAHGGTVAAGSDTGAYRVYPPQGLLDERDLLKVALGEDAESMLDVGEKCVRERFRR